VRCDRGDVPVIGRIRCGLRVSASRTVAKEPSIEDVRVKEFELVHSGGPRLRFGARHLREVAVGVDGELEACGRAFVEIERGSDQPEPDEEHQPRPPFPTRSDEEHRRERTGKYYGKPELADEEEGD